MTTYKIDKPVKGAGLIEYILKYFTIFIVLGFSIWAIILVLSTSGILPKSIYMVSFYLSVGITSLVIGYLIVKTINKIKQGIIYQIDFDDKKQIVSLYLINEFTGDYFLSAIDYSNLKIEDKKQKIDVKAEQKLKIYNNSELINVFHIKKTPWTAHPRIALVVKKFREINK